MKFLKQNFPTWFKVNSKNSLSSLYPNLAEEFIKIKNGCFTVDNVSNETNKNHKETQKFWWKCPKGDDHVYQATIRSRVYDLKSKKESCSMCKGEIVVRSNSLAFLEPNISKYWNYELNGNYNPKNIWFNDSSKKFYWLCEKSKHHKQKTTVSLRREKPNCGYCENSLINLRPQIKSFYNPSLNNGISLYDILYSPTRYGNEDWSVIGMPNKKEFTWVCENKHSWQSSIKSKLRHQSYLGSKAGGHLSELIDNCPHCKNISESLKSKNPQLAKYWHPTRNIIQPTEIKPSSNKDIWWKCDNGHEWYEPLCNIVRRTKGTGILLPSAQLQIKACKRCKREKAKSSQDEIHKNQNKKREMNSLRKKNDKMIFVKRNPTLDEQRKDLIPYWHPTKNMNISIKQFNLDSDEIVWWKCPEGDDHEWKDSIKKTGKRKKPFWCPICAKAKVVLSNCLATTNPELLDKWHPTKNRGITPFEITDGTKKLFWWKCPQGADHEWQTSAKKMAKGSGKCMVCNGKVITATNNLLYKYPKIAGKFHKNENSNMIPEKIYYQSTKKYWWKCDINPKHKWNATIASVMKNNKCPNCTKYENTQTESKLKIAEKSHPNKNGLLTKMHEIENNINTYKFEFNGKFDSDMNAIRNIIDPLLKDHKILDAVSALEDVLKNEPEYQKLSFKDYFQIVNEVYEEIFSS